MFKENLIHLIIGYGNARHDMALARERENDILYAGAKAEAESLLNKIKEEYYSSNKKVEV